MDDDFDDFQSAGGPPPGVTPTSAVANPSVRTSTLSPALLLSPQSKSPPVPSADGPRPHSPLADHYGPHLHPLYWSLLYQLPPPFTV